MHAAKVATEFRQKFCRDVVVDVFCYRRFGHNEGDEPMFTQPKMYRIIKNHKTTLELYSERLANEGLVPAEETEGNKKAFRDLLNSEFDLAESYRPNEADWLDGRWAHIQSQTDDDQRGKTGVPLRNLKEIGKALVEVPEDFSLHPTLSRLLAARRKVFETGEGQGAVAIFWRSACAGFWYLSGFLYMFFFLSKVSSLCFIVYSFLGLTVFSFNHVVLVSGNKPFGVSCALIFILSFLFRVRFTAG